MIYHQGRETAAAYAAGRALSMIYAGARLVWQAIRSCYGAGLWQAAKPWSRTDPWRRKP